MFSPNILEFTLKISEELKAGDMTNLLTYRHIARGKKLYPSESFQIDRIITNILIYCCQQVTNAVGAPLFLFKEINLEDRSKFDEFIDILYKSIELDNGTALANNVNALYLLGFHIENGIELPKNINVAIKLYEKSIQLGYVYAIWHRAEMHRRGIGGAINDERAHELLFQGAELGSPWCMVDLANIYLKNKNFEQAILLYKKAEKLECPAAMLNLGNLYQEGRGVPTDIKETIRLLDKAAKLGYPRAQVRRAEMHLWGIGASKNREEAIKLLEEAIILWHSPAMLRLAGIFAGEGGPENRKKAIALLKTAMFLGNIEAMAMRAKVFLDEGGLENREKAIVLLERAILKKCTSALIVRAQIHMKDGDSKNAGRLLRKAAREDHEFAKETLSKPGQIYFTYHHLMLQNEVKNLEELLNLLQTSPPLIKEFCEYDCIHIRELQPDPEFLIELLKRIRNSDIEAIQFNKICSLLLISLSAEDIANSLAFDNKLRKITEFCLNKIVWGDIDKNHLVQLTHVLLDLYWLEADYKEFVVHALVKLISRINSLTDLDNLNIPIKQMAIILVQKIWGQDYDINMGEEILWSKLNLLAALCNDTIKPDISLAQSLGFTWIQKLQTTPKKRHINETNNPEYTNPKRLFSPSSNNSDLNNPGDVDIEECKPELNGPS